jgi:hypothetical protein
MNLDGALEGQWPSASCGAVKDVEIEQSSRPVESLTRNLAMRDAAARARPPARRG